MAEAGLVCAFLIADGGIKPVKWSALQEGKNFMTFNNFIGVQQVLHIQKPAAPHHKHMEHFCIGVTILKQCYSCNQEKRMKRYPLPLVSRWNKCSKTNDQSVDMLGACEKWYWQLHRTYEGLVRIVSANRCSCIGYAVRVVFVTLSFPSLYV